MLPGLSRAELEQAARLVHSAMPPTPQLSWPLLNLRAGCEIWVKHENHTATGAFKIRGGIVMVGALKRAKPKLAGIISATRGNSRDKNAAMRAWGAELIEHGRDFDEAKDHAAKLAREQGLESIGPFHAELVAGVGSYAFELFSSVAELDSVYVPIGCGSGICGLISWRDALGLETRIIGVVSEKADCYARSIEAGKPVETASADTFADGIAVRVPVPAALDIIRAGAERIVRVSDDEVKAAVRCFYSDTHNLVEGAGAAPLAALLKDNARRGKRFAVIASGGNIDREAYVDALSEKSSFEKPGGSNER